MQLADVLDCVRLVVEFHVRANLAGERLGAAVDNQMLAKSMIVSESLMTEVALRAAEFVPAGNYLEDEEEKNGHQHGTAIMAQTRRTRAEDQVHKKQPCVLVQGRVL